MVNNKKNIFLEWFRRCEFWTCPKVENSGMVWNVKIGNGPKLSNSEIVQNVESMEWPKM